jgi:hypothetical protein
LVVVGDEGFRQSRVRLPNLGAAVAGGGGAVAAVAGSAAEAVAAIGQVEHDKLEGLGETRLKMTWNSRL